MGESGTEWSTQLRSWEREADKEEPVGNRPKSTTNSPNHPSLTELCAAFTSLVAVAVANRRTRSFNRNRPPTGALHMFRGNHPTRVDEKGRLKIPAEFKRVIDEKYGQQFYITSLDGKVAQVYPFEEWERIEQKLAGLSTFNPTKKKFLDRVNYYGQHGGDGWARAAADAATAARCGARSRARLRLPGNLTYLDSAQPGAVPASRSRKKSSRLTMRRRSTNWASSGRGFNRHPSGGWAWWWKGSEPSFTKSCSGSFKRSDRLFKRAAWRDLYRRHGGPGRAQLRNRKTPRRTGTFDWAR